MTRLCAGLALKSQFLLLLLLAFCLVPVRAQQPEPAATPAPQAAPAPAPESAPAPTSFFLHDGDTVVFYGDSITEQGHYTRDIETWTLTHHPDWHVRFINSGWNSDTAGGGKGGPIDVRLKRDVLPYHPTVVTILLGTNDAHYHAFGEAEFAAYTQGMTHLIDTLTQALPSVRLVLLTPTFYDEFAPGSHHIKNYNAVLQRYGAFVRTLAQQRGLTAVDLNTPLREATVLGRKTNPRFTLVPDGVHPNEAGHLIMAATILRAWNAEPDVPTVQASPQTEATLTLPLPWPLPEAARSALAVSPAAAALAGLRLQASADGPPTPGTGWSLTVGNAPSVVLPAAQFVQGNADLGGFSGLPPNAQAHAVLVSVQERLETWRYLWKGGPHAVARKNDSPTDSETAALVALDGWLDTRREEARQFAQPQARAWTIRPLSSVPLPKPAHPSRPRLR